MRVEDHQPIETFRPNSAHEALRHPLACHVRNGVRITSILKPSGGRLLQALIELGGRLCASRSIERERVGKEHLQSR